MKGIKPLLRNKWWILLPVAIAAALIGIFFWNRQTAAADTAQPVYETSQAYVGDLSSSATGTGTLVSGRTIDLAFPVDGVVDTLNVQVGQQVKAGEALASLQEVNALKVNVQNKELALKTAQDALNDLLTGGNQAVAQALLDRANAQSAYATAQKNVRQKGVSRCSQDQIVSYYYSYLYAQERVDQWESYLYDGNTGYGLQYMQQKLMPMRRDRDLASYNLHYCEGYTDQEILESQSALQLAEAKMKKAEKDYQTALTHAGVDPRQVELAEASVKNAELQLTKAQKELQGAALTAPVDATVLSVTARPGAVVEGGETYLTLTDLQHPQVKVSIDETDLGSFYAGCSAQVTLDAFPKRVLTGEVIETSPALVSSGNTKVVQGVVELKDAELVPGKTLPLNLTSVVDITCLQAQGVLLIPAAALHQNADQQTYVYVFNSAGQPEQRMIEVGLKSSLLVEVRSGLTEGETVITAGGKLP